MKEEVKNEVCKIDKNYLVQKINQLKQSAVIQELNYLESVLATAEEVKSPIDESKQETE